MTRRTLPLLAAVAASTFFEGFDQAILALVREESSRHPHSDQDMVRLLNDQGLAVARRTVAKYREQLGILPSHLRKSF